MLPVFRALRSGFRTAATAVCSVALVATAPAQEVNYRERALEVTDYIHKHFWDSKRDLYRAHIDKPEPDYIWGGGVMFSALVGAARHEKRYRSIMRKYFDGLESYWDTKVKIPGYEPAPTAGGGNDKYYDDNAWMVMMFLEAYELTGERRYVKRAEEVLKFVLSGWDDEAGGGIWWHEKHKDGTKTTCANAPAAVGCLRMAKFSDPEMADFYTEEARKIMTWTVDTLQGPDGLFSDSLKVATGSINPAKLTYNSALMLRAFLGLHVRTGNELSLKEAQRIARSAEGLLGRETGAYRDAIKWAHLMVEADIELHRTTGEDYLIERAKRNCDHHYQSWKTNPPPDLIANASLARELWLMADRETPEGRAFWEASDKPTHHR